MHSEEDENEVLSIEDSPEMDEVSEPKVASKFHDPNKHLGKIDPVLMEKLAKVEKQENGHQQKYINGLPVFTTKRESSPLFGSLAFLLTLLVGFGAIRMYMGEPVVPVALKEMVLGKDEPVILPPAKFTVDTNIVGYEVSVNGVKQTLYNNQFEVPAGQQPVTVVVSRVGYSTYTTQVTPASNTHAVIKPVLAQQKANGFLSYETVPGAKLTLFLDGKVAAEFNTPINGVKVPVGTYQAVLENSFIGFRKEQIITVEEWKTTSFRLELQNAAAATANNNVLPAVTPVSASQ